MWIFSKTWEYIPSFDITFILETYIETIIEINQIGIDL